MGRILAGVVAAMILATAWLLAIGMLLQAEEARSPTSTTTLGSYGDPYDAQQ